MSDEKVFATKVKGKTMECMTRERKDAEGSYTELNFKPVGKKSYSYAVKSGSDNPVTVAVGASYTPVPEPVCWSPNRNCKGFMEHRPYTCDDGHIFCMRCGLTVKKANLWQKFKHWARGIKWAYFF